MFSQDLNLTKYATSLTIPVFVKGNCEAEVSKYALVSVNLYWFDIPLEDLPLWNAFRILFTLLAQWIFFGTDTSAVRQSWGLALEPNLDVLITAFSLLGYIVKQNRCYIVSNSSIQSRYRTN